jgi:hypothetical protein
VRDCKPFTRGPAPFFVINFKTAKCRRHLGSSSKKIWNCWRSCPITLLACLCAMMSPQVAVLARSVCFAAAAVEEIEAATDNATMESRLLETSRFCKVAAADIQTAADENMKPLLDMARFCAAAAADIQASADDNTPGQGSLQQQQPQDPKTSARVACPSRPRHRRWEFEAVIGFGIAESEALRLWIESGQATYLTVGLELLPEIGRFYIHGYVETRDLCYLGIMKRRPLPNTWHWEPALGTPEECSRRCQTPNLHWESGRRSDSLAGEDDDTSDTLVVGEGGQA